MFSLFPIGRHMTENSTMMHLGFLLLVLFISTSTSHPQCLNFRPPFEAQKIEFCKEYAEFGCCNQDDDNAIRKKHFQVLFELENRLGVVGCREKLRRVLCLQCNPYAAHVYDAEATLTQRPFPGLCKSYCEDFYDTCIEALPLLTEDETTRTSAESRSLFCEHNAAPDPQYCYPNLDTDGALLFNISREGRTDSDCVCLESVASQLRNPLLLKTPPDESHRMFVAEQKGFIHIFFPNNTQHPELFMDLSKAVHVTTSRGDERGFLGLAFHPKFAENRRFFVYYYAIDDGSHVTILSEFLQDPEDSMKVQEDSERVLMKIDQPFSNHNGGEVRKGR